MFLGDKISLRQAWVQVPSLVLQAQALSSEVLQAQALSSEVLQHFSTTYGPSTTTQAQN